MQTMRIEINEMAKAFRVNGVTFAKRHLASTIGKDCGDNYERMLAKFLVIVPFLAEAFQCPDNASESVKYGAYKAKRLHKALGINSDNKIGFMLMALSQAELGTDPDENGMVPGIKALGQELRENGFYGDRANVPFQQGKRQDATILPFPGKRTLH